MHKMGIPKKVDFHSFIAMQPEARWAFQELFSSSNGKDIAQAIASGTCVAVLDGSFKDICGTAAWILTHSNTVTLSGYTMVPGSPDDQGSFRSELVGIYSTVHMVNHVCHYYKVTHRSILFGCDRQSTLQQCFTPH